MTDNWSLSAVARGEPGPVVRRRQPGGTEWSAAEHVVLADHGYAASERR